MGETMEEIIENKKELEKTDDMAEEIAAIWNLKLISKKQKEELIKWLTEKKELPKETKDDTENNSAEKRYQEILAANPNMSLDFAKQEYVRLMVKDPSWAIPFLKIIATKAKEKSEWKIFDTLMLSSLLVWVFNQLNSKEHEFIQEFCKVRWFLPGVWSKDLPQHLRTRRLLDIITTARRKKNFSKAVSYSPEKFHFNEKNRRNLVDKFQSRYDKKGDLVSESLKLSGKTARGKTLLEIYNDPKTSAEDKTLLGEVLEASSK